MWLNSCGMLNQEIRKYEIEKIQESKQIQPFAFGVGIGFVVIFLNRYGFFNLPFSNSLDLPNLPFEKNTELLWNNPILLLYKDLFLIV